MTSPGVGEAVGAGSGPEEGGGDSSGGGEPESGGGEPESGGGEEPGGSTGRSPTCAPWARLNGPAAGKGSSDWIDVPPQLRTGPWSVGAAEAGAAAAATAATAAPVEM